MKNFRKIAFGLLVGALALGFSAFTSTHKLTRNTTFVKHAGMITEGFIAQTVAGNEFDPESSVDGDNCSDATTSYSCTYTVTSTGASNIPEKSSYTASDMNSYLSHSPAWLTANGSANKVYNP